jgi:voltage-gated potassium channel
VTSRLSAPPGDIPSGFGLRDAFRRFERRIFWAVLYYNTVLAAGTVGYRLIEQWSWFDSLYMSVITATSVGFSEVHPLTPSGRLFTMVLLVFSVVGLGLLWAITTALIVELDLTDIFRRKRMHKKIEDLSGHYVVCGAGRMGRVIVGEMIRAGVSCLLIERDRARIESLLDRYPDLLFIEGDATKDHCLEAAGIRRAKGLAAALAEDTSNLFLCLTARALNQDLVIASRAIDGESVAKMHQAGANHIISPNVTGGVRMVATLLKPSVVSFLDAATIADEVSLRLEELAVPPRSRLAGKSLAEARIPQETGLIVLALRRRESHEPAVFNPGPDTRLGEGDVMIVLGMQEQVDRLREFAGA